MTDRYEWPQGNPLFETSWQAIYEAANGNGILADGALEVDNGGNADLSLSVSSGDYWYDGTKKNYGGTSNLSITQGDSADPRWDLVYIDVSSNSVSVRQGTAQTKPDAPAVNQGEIPLALVYVTSSDSSIENSQILNQRAHADEAGNVHVVDSAGEFSNNNAEDVFNEIATDYLQTGGDTIDDTITLADFSGAAFSLGLNPGLYGAVVDFDVDSNSSQGTEHAYSFAANANNILRVVAEADGAGGVQNTRLEMENIQAINTAINVISQLNINGNQITQFGPERVTSDPTTNNFDGRLIYRTDTNEIKIYKDSSYKILSSGTSTSASSVSFDDSNIGITAGDVQTLGEKLYESSNLNFTDPNNEFSSGNVEDAIAETTSLLVKESGDTMTGELQVERGSDSDFLTVRNTATSDELRITTDANDYLALEIHDSSAASTKTMMQWRPSESQIRVRDDILFDNLTGSPSFSGHDHTSGGMTTIPLATATDTDFAGNQALGMVLETLTSSPASNNTEGRIWWDSGNDELNIHDGTGYIVLNAAGNISVNDSNLAYTAADLQTALEKVEEAINSIVNDADGHYTNTNVEDILDEIHDKHYKLAGDTLQGDIDFATYQALKFVVENRTADPTSNLSDGRMWWRTDTNTLKMYNGSSVVDLQSATNISFDDSSTTITASTVQAAIELIEHAVNILFDDSNVEFTASNVKSALEALESASNLLFDDSNVGFTASTVQAAIEALEDADNHVFDDGNVGFTASTTQDAIEQTENTPVQDIINAPNYQFPNASLADTKHVRLPIPVQDSQTVTIYKWGCRDSSGSTPSGLTIELWDESDTSQSSANTGNNENSNGITSLTNSSGSLSYYWLVLKNATGSDYSDPDFATGFASVVIE